MSNNTITSGPNYYDEPDESFESNITASVDYWYHEKKVNVIPTRLRGKTPNIDSWIGYKTNRIPKETFESWKRDGLFENGFGVMLGRTYSSNEEELYLIGIDCDTEQAIKEFSTVNGVSRPKKELSLRFRTEQHKDDLNSLHIYFFSPIPFPTKGADTKLGLEVKGSAEGSGYLITSPSLHPNGSHWEVLGTHEPPKLTKVQAIEMMQHINTICKEHGLEYLDKSSGSIITELKKAIKTLRLDHRVQVAINEGERHSNMVSIANSILFNHLQINDNNTNKLKGFFEEINSICCIPNPLPQDEIDSIWSCAVSFVKKNKDFTNNNFNGPDGVKTNADEVKNLIERTTERILESNHFLTFEESRDIYHYKNGVYVHGGDILIEKEAEKICGYEISNKHITEIKGHVARRTYHKREELDADLNIINLQNGLYHIDKNVLLPHSPDYLSINQKPITYDPNTRPQIFGKFLKDVLYPSEIRTAVEAMAYTFYRDCPYEHFFKLFGYGSNGKSVFTGLLTAMHDTRNISNVPISSLVDNRFAISDLEFKDVNIDTELSNIFVKDTSNLKKLTGGRKQPIRIERKNQKAYDTYLHAKLFINTNSISETIDQTAAYYRREIIISFPNTFEGTGKDDPFLLEKLSSEQEMSGIFNIMMIALRTLLKRNGLYLNEKTIEERREKYEKAVNPIRAFLDEAILEESVESDTVIKDDMYDAYVKYCNKYKIAKKQKESLGKELKKNKIEDGRMSVEIDGKRKMCWKRVKLRPEYEKVIEMNMVVTSGTS
ncbi:MAG TPA: phage/plasmid primase, P4 family [Candidatus Nitrosocosmicus sp.]|nr:phage/plasmid primase, P4 family [Candidatus Nitrosocosmicus sp.]